VAGRAVSAPGGKVRVTGRPLVVGLATEGAGGMGKRVAGEVPVDEGLGQLAESVDAQLKDAGLG